MEAQRMSADQSNHEKRNNVGGDTAASTREGWYVTKLWSCFFYKLGAFVFSVI